MADTPKLIYLVPSGDTRWQDQDRVQGNTDLPLSDEGQRQAGAMAAAWSGGEVKTVYCGPDEASRQTAAALAERLAARVKAVDELAEMNLGLWQGLTEEELKDRFRSTYSQWLQEPATVNIPHGEAVDAAQVRVEAAVTRLIAKSGAGPLVLVLRPVVLNLCTQWLGASAVSQTHTSTQRSGEGRDALVIRCFEIDEPTWRNPRALRQNKRMSA